MKLSKHIYYTVFIPLLAMTALFMSSCEQDGNGVYLESPDGPAEVHYIRVPNPDASDSLLVKADLGTEIVIIGANLGDTRAVYFNDQEATINPTWVTNRAVFVTVPRTPAAPEVTTNELYLVNSQGDTLVHDFEVTIPPPFIEKLKSEWIPVGEDLVIEGDYFFEPLTVLLPDGSEAEVKEVTQQSIRVGMPVDMESGYLTVMTDFGTVVSTHRYKDDRGIFGTMEPEDYDGALWHRSSWFSNENETPEVPNINGSYIRVKQTIGGGWGEWFVGDPSMDPNSQNSINVATQRIPDDAFVNPGDYSLKFEMITLSPTDATKGWYIYFGHSMGSRRTESNANGKIAYNWKPGTINTKGEWETMIIPFDEIMQNNNSGPNELGYGFSFFFWDFEGSLNVDFAIDNIRVVPNE